jgi:hypothetical protein
MKRCIYHLHIPRTSGVLIRELFKKNNPKSFIVSGHKEKLYRTDMMNADFISGHYGTLPIEYSSDIFAIYREPVERTFSYLKYIWPRFYARMSFDEFLKFFLNDPVLVDAISNQQSKFLTGNINLEKYNDDIYYLKKMVESNWHVENFLQDSKSILEYIDINNIKMFDYAEPNVYQKISELFKLNIDISGFDDVINPSLDIKEKQYISYIDQIREINLLDLELYNYVKK